MERSVNVAVIYYSSTGTIHRIATEIVEIAEKSGAEVRTAQGGGAGATRQPWSPGLPGRRTWRRPRTSLSPM